MAKESERRLEPVKKELWTVQFRREQLLEFVDGRGPQPRREDIPGLEGLKDDGQLIGVWCSSGAEGVSPLPQVIVGHEQSLHDLFAWSASYLRGLAPLTSLVRTLTPKRLATVLHSEPTDERWRIAGGAVGLLLAETCIRSEQPIGINDAAVYAPNATLSFAILRAWSLGYPIEVVHEILDNYTNLWREFGPSSSDSLHRALSDSVMSVATALLGKDSLRSEAGQRRSRATDWMGLLRQGRSVFELMSEVMKPPQELFGGHVSERMKEMTAEERVQVFDTLAPSILQGEGRGDRMEAAFALALGAFVCRPGFVQQATLLGAYTDRFPEALLWLGALQAFAPMPEVLLLRSGAGWRIARELFRADDVWEAPRADAAVDELRTLLRVKSRSYLSLIDRARFNVEIYPLIVTTFRGAQDQLVELNREGELYAQTLSAQERDLFDKFRLLESQLMNCLGTLREFRSGKRRTGPRREPPRRK